MNYQKYFLFFAVTIISLRGNVCNAQESIPQDLEQAYESFDATIGRQNTEIFTGVEYIEKHRMINEKHKFFNLNDFVPVTVFYEGQPYFKIASKYNIFDDILLVKLPSQRGETDFKLLETRLDGFILQSKRFINIYKPGSEVSGIYELLFDSSNMQVLKKYRKTYKKVSSRNIVHYEFKSRDPKYFFQYSGNYYELSRKNLMQLFPNNKDEVREQYKKYRKQKKNRQDEALVAMFQNLSELSNDQTP